MQHCILYRPDRHGHHRGARGFGHKREWNSGDSGEGHSGEDTSRKRGQESVEEELSDGHSHHRDRPDEV